FAMYAIVVIILVAPVHIAVPLGCPHEWTFFDGYCWWRSDRYLNWAQAKEYCENNDSELALMNSTRQIAFLNDLESEDEASLLNERSGYSAISLLSLLLLAPPVHHSSYCRHLHMLFLSQPSSASLSMSTHCNFTGFLTLW
uniref:C-type lectin domain-containing protein n=1 Tax=Parascaris univalens TaxID=6257 RepID=A0A915B8F3_PARUN